MPTCCGLTHFLEKLFEKMLNMMEILKIKIHLKLSNLSHSALYFIRRNGVSLGAVLYSYAQRAPEASAFGLAVRA